MCIFNKRKKYWDRGATKDRINTAQKFLDYVKDLERQGLPYTHEKYITAIHQFKHLHINLYDEMVKKRLKLSFSPRTRRTVIIPFIKTYIKIGLVIKDAGLLKI